MVLEIPTLTMVTTRYPGMEGGGGGGQHGGGLVVGQPPNHNQPPPLNHQPLGLAAPRPLSHHQVVNVLCLCQNMNNTLTSFQLVGLPGYTGYHRPEELASLYRWSAFGDWYQRSKELEIETCNFIALVFNDSNICLVMVPSKSTAFDNVDVQNETWLLLKDIWLWQKKKKKISSCSPAVCSANKA